MKRYEAADRRLRATLDESAGAPPNFDALFERIDERRTLADRLPNLWYAHRRKLAVLVFLLGISLAAAWTQWPATAPTPPLSETKLIAPSTTGTDPAHRSPTTPFIPDDQPAATVNKTTSYVKNADSPKDPFTEAKAFVGSKGNKSTRRSTAAGTRPVESISAPFTSASSAVDPKKPSSPGAELARLDRLANAELSEAAPPAANEPTAIVASRPTRTQGALNTLYVPELANLPRLPVDPKISCADFRKAAEWHTQIEILSGPELSFRSLQAQGNEANVYAYNRRRTERPWYTVQTQVRVSLKSSRGWAFRTGLSLTDRHEKLDYAGENAERISIENVYDSMGNLIRTDTVTELGQRVVRWNNRYRRLDVPLLAGYAWRAHPFDVHLNAGVLLNIWTHTKGRRLTPDGATLTDDWSDYRPRILPDAYLSAGFNYRFTTRWTVQMEPHLRYQFGSLTTAAAPVRQQYTSFGLLAGLRYQF